MPSVAGPLTGAVATWYRHWCISDMLGELFTTDGIFVTGRLSMR